MKRTLNPIPWHPETVEALRRRYPAALEQVFDQEEVTLGTTARPGQVPANVFQFSDGCHLIVSREREARTGKLLTHVSASVRHGSELFEHLRRSSCLLDQWRRLDHILSALEAHVRLLAGPVRLEFQFWSDGLVPHWLIKDEVNGG